MTTRARRTVRDVLVGVAAAVLVFAAVPGILVGFVGMPIPAHWSAHEIVSWRGLFDALAVISWAAWAACAVPILRGVVRRVRQRDVASGTRWLDRLAVRIAAGVLAVTSIAGSAPLAAGASTRAPTARASAMAMPIAGVRAVADGRQPALGAVSHHRDRAGDSHHRVRAGDSHHRVRAGDSLPAIAERHYGDAGAWAVVADANLGRLMTDTLRFVDPTVVVPGWSLLVPQLEAVPRPDAGASVPGTTPPEAPAPTAPGAVALTALPIAELAGAGVSALVAALLARRARQLRRLQAFLREEGAPTPRPTEAEAELSTLISPFADIPLVEWIELAARHLRAALACVQGSERTVQWLRAGVDGVEVHFGEDAPEELAGWRRAEPGSWLLPSSTDPRALGLSLPGDPWCPVLLPLGDDERGSWLLPVEVGASVAVVGPRAPDVARAMASAVRAWSWSEQLVVTDDVATVTRTLGSPQAAIPGIAPHVLYVGDPAALPEHLRRLCAVLTIGTAGNANVTVVVDERAASAHPLGLTVRPSLLVAAREEAVSGLLTLPGPAAEPGHTGASLLANGDAGTRCPDTPAPLPLVGRQPRPAQIRLEGTHAVRTGAPALATEVRLLTSVPQICGLKGELPPNRARRAVEVVAYLAMHAPEPVTGERLRTRVLGSADVDAAAKTLFNTVGAARRALGSGPDGQPLLPPATRLGYYRISPDVSVDALRASSLLQAGLSAADEGEALGLLQEALSLLHAEPLSGMLTGYGWWRTEGHERRLADLVVDGACALVRVALSGDRVDLARWAVAQARKVEPYSEVLSRAALRVAAASLDMRRLHEEWRTCLRHADELDPGSVPSEQSERLYVALRTQLAQSTGAERDARQASFAAIDAAPCSTVPSAPSTV